MIALSKNIKLFDKTTIKFLAVGVVNTLVGTSVMFLCYNLFHLNFWISSAANYIVGSIVSFLLNKYFTFKSSEKSLKQVLLFAVNIGLCYFLAYGIAKPLVTLILGFAVKSLRENIAMLVGAILFVGFNYFGQRFIVFKTAGKDGQ